MCLRRRVDGKGGASRRERVSTGQASERRRWRGVFQWDINRRSGADGDAVEAQLIIAVAAVVDDVGDVLLDVVHSLALLTLLNCSLYPLRGQQRDGDDDRGLVSGLRGHAELAAQ